MDRLTLDQTGARTGRISARSLRMGDDTVNINNIATMSIEQQSFQPYRTPRNRQMMGLWVGFCLMGFFFAFVFLAWWIASEGGLFRLSGLVGWLSFIVFWVAGFFAARLWWAMRKTEIFFRLRIGASDGRNVDLVDDSRPTLLQIHDVVQFKMDNGDQATTGEFNLDTDTVTLDGPGAHQSA